jgi:hypothetical protein
MQAGVLIICFSLNTCNTLEVGTHVEFWAARLDDRGIGIRESDAATAFWNASKHLDQNTSCLVFPEGVAFLGDNAHGSVLYYRRAYARLRFETTEVSARSSQEHQAMERRCLVLRWCVKHPCALMDPGRTWCTRDPTGESTDFIFVNDRGFVVRQRQARRSSIRSSSSSKTLAPFHCSRKDALRCTTIQIGHKRFHGFEKEGRAKRSIMLLREDEGCSRAAHIAILTSRRTPWPSDLSGAAISLRR